jgi:hypothetical protein
VALASVARFVCLALFLALKGSVEVAEGCDRLEGLEGTDIEDFARGAEPPRRRAPAHPRY